MRLNVCGSTVLILLTLSAAGCDDIRSFAIPTNPSIPPTSPTPTIPTVSGSYSGSARVLFTDLDKTLTCPVATTVTQSGAAVSFALILTGDCKGMNIPIGPVSIDSTGQLPRNGFGGGAYPDPSCEGTYIATIAAGGFSSGELQIFMSAYSFKCENFNVNAVLSR